jgi:HSP20 family molecular chaperone IbpA
MVSRGLSEVMGHCRDAQVVPVKMYESADRLTVAVPMPGAEPEDVCVEVTPGGQLILYSSGRGALKDEKLVHSDEWNVGPYCRELTLPSPVDGSMANVTYRNGILVVALPLAEVTRPAHLGLDSVGPDYGERVGNAGHPVHRLTSSEHNAGRPKGQHDHHS